MTISDVILCFLFLIFALAIYGFFDVRAEQRKDNANRRRLELIQWKADNLGNFPDWVNPYTGERVQGEPGNAAFPEQPQYVIGNSPVTPIKPQRRETPININLPPGYKFKDQENYTVQNVVPEQLPAPEVERERSVNDIHSENIGELLADAKSRGGAKQATIKELTGAMPGAGEDWIYYSQLWDNLPGKKKQKKAGS